MKQGLRGEKNNKSTGRRSVQSESAIDNYRGYVGCNTGNGEKLSSSQAQLGQATCLDVA